MGITPKPNTYLNPFGPASLNYYTNRASTMDQLEETKFMLDFTSVWGLTADTGN